jgi:hypothetical protein
MSRIGSGNSSPERKRKLRQIMTNWPQNPRTSTIGYSQDWEVQDITTTIPLPVKLEWRLMVGHCRWWYVTKHSCGTWCQPWFAAKHGTGGMQVWSTTHSISLRMCMPPSDGW